MNDRVAEYDEDHDPLNGRYVSPEHERILRAYDKACDENDEVAKQEYFRQALEVEKQEAAKGNPLAMFYLGVYYCRASGAEKDMVKAKELLVKAHNAGVERAETFLLTDFGDPEDARIIPSRLEDFLQMNQGDEEDDDLMAPNEQDDGECEMGRPCGNKECVRFVEERGGDPESPADWICSTCGGEGPMRRYFDQYPDEDNDN